MEKIIPAVSSSVVGPLGIAHLPRLWLTAIALASGQLAAGYSAHSELDDKFAVALQLEPESFAAFLRTRPTYAQTEAWVFAHPGRIDPETVATHNANLGDVQQTDLDDWARLHAFLAARRGTTIAPMVPLVSMDTPGPLGIKLLPRLWIKALLHAAGALPDSWRSGETRVVYTDGIPGTLATPGQGMDASTVANLGLDMSATIAFLHGEQPTYPQFEAWVSANARNLEPTTITAHNAGPPPVSGERPTAELARMGYPEMSSCGMYLYNDLADWDAVHTQLLNT